MASKDETLTLLLCDNEKDLEPFVSRGGAVSTSMLVTEDQPEQFPSILHDLPVHIERLFFDVAMNALTPQGAITEAPHITDQTTNDSELHEVIYRPGYLYPGVNFTVDVHMNKNSKQRTNTAAETVDRIERFETDDGRLGYRVTWRYIGMPFFLSHNERIHEFLESVDPTSGEKVTEYIGWETYGGLAALIIKYTIHDRFRDSFQRWRDDFKAAIETS